jgi:hypothetical protein
MDIKEIAFVVAGVIIFILAGLILLRAADEDHLKLLKWSITTSNVLLIFSLMISLYNDYHIDKSFDFYAFGVYDLKEFFNDYFLVAFNLFFLILQVPIKLLVRWKGVTNPIGEQKLNTFITLSLFVCPLFNIFCCVTVFKFW